jgi:hypothetical protein
MADEGLTGLRTATQLILREQKAAAVEAEQEALVELDLLNRSSLVLAPLARRLAAYCSPLGATRRFDSPPASVTGRKTVPYS